MCTQTLPPPQPPVCLTRSYKSREVKGGTIIAEDVLDFETHRQLLADPDAYRKYVGPCRACRAEKCHAHCFRVRILRPASPAIPPTMETVRIYRCPVGTCGAVFMVLPAIIARHLWREWKTVEEVTSGKADAPRSTSQRWMERVGSCAAQLVHLLRALGSSLLPPRMRRGLAKIQSRGQLLVLVARSSLPISGQLYAYVASWVHRLEPGVRLM